MASPTNVLIGASASEIAQAQSLIARGKIGATRGDPRMSRIITALQSVPREQARQLLREAERRGEDISKFEVTERRGLVSVKTPVKPPLPTPKPKSALLEKLQAKERADQLREEARGTIFLTASEARQRDIKPTTAPAGTKPTKDQQAIFLAEEILGKSRGTSGAVGVKPRVRKKDFGIERPQLSVVKREVIALPVIKELVALERATNLQKLLEDAGSDVKVVATPVPISSVGSIATLGKTTLFFAGQTSRVGKAGGFTRTAFTTAKGEKGIAQSFTLFGKQQGVDVGLTLTTGGRVQRVVSATGKEQNILSKTFIGGEVFQTQKAGTTIKQIGAGRTFFVKGGGLTKGKDFISVGKAGELNKRIFSSGGIFQKGGGVARQGGILDVVGKGKAGTTINTGNLKSFQQSTATARASLSQQQTIASSQPIVSKTITPISKILTTLPLTAVGIQTLKQFSPKQKVSQQTKVTTIFKQQGLSKTLQRQRSILALKSLTTQKAIQSSVLAGATQQKVITTLAPKLLGKAKTTQAVRLAQVPALRVFTALKSARGISPPLTPKTIIGGGLILPLKGGKKKKKRKGLFGVAIKKKGKFETIGAGLSLGRAFAVGKERVSAGISGTFKILGTGIKTIPIPRGFRLTRDPKLKGIAGIRVEKRKFRISRAGERIALKRARKQ